MICKFYGRPFLPPDNGGYLQNVDPADAETDSTDSIFKTFLSFIYSANKGFISSSKLSSELYLAEGWTTNKKEGNIFPGTFSMENSVIVYFSF